MLAARWPAPGAPRAPPLAPWPRMRLLYTPWRPSRARPVAYAVFRALQPPPAPRLMAGALGAALLDLARREPGADELADRRGAWGRCGRDVQRASGAVRGPRRPAAHVDCFSKLFIKMTIISGI